MLIWTPDLDITTVPDAVLLPEAARRNGAKRKSYTGGKFWAQHNPDTARCRCKPCSTFRAGGRPSVREFAEARGWKVFDVSVIDGFPGWPVLVQKGREWRFYEYEGDMEGSPWSMPVPKKRAKKAPLPPDRP